MNVQQLVRVCIVVVVFIILFILLFIYIFLLLYFYSNEVCNLISFLLIQLQFLFNLQQVIIVDWQHVTGYIFLYDRPLKNF